MLTPSVQHSDADFLALLRRLDAIGAAANQGDPDVLERILDAAAWAAPGAQPALLRYHPDRHTLEPGPAPAAAFIALETRRPVEAETAEDGPLCAFPLIAADQPAGVLLLRFEHPRRLSELERLALLNLSRQAAAALSQARWLHNAAAKDEEVARLRQAGLLISSRLGLEETLRAILEMALEVTGAHYGIFRLLDPAGQSLVTGAVAGDYPAQPLIETLPVDTHSVMGWVAYKRQPVLIPDLRAEPWRSVYYPLDFALEMRSELAVPLIGAGGRLEGVLNLESPDVGGFSEADSQMLQSLATQAVIAIQEARLVDALQEVARLLLTESLDGVLERLAGLACALLNAGASAIWTVEADDLLLQATSGAGDHDPRMPLAGSLAGAAVRSGALLQSADLRHDPRFRRPDLAQRHGWTQALVAPLLAGSERPAAGAFAVYAAADRPGRFANSEWDRKVLSILAYYAALAVQNAAGQEALRAVREQRAVAETFAAVGDIAANVLHHLNNKVGAIPVRVQGIQDKCAPALAADAYLAANLREIELSASQAMEAVRENLTNLRPLTMTEVDVAGCVQAALQSAALPARVQVTSAGLEGLPRVLAAERSLTLVFTNLLENAASAMQGQGQIHIQGGRRGSWVEAAVTDSGPGVPPGLHDRIFELNFSGRGQSGKLGFGLWWVKTLMTRLGGAVQVESDGAHGATFRLRLPAVENNR